jgi:PIN domain nuclease of toxin-antitoxin system
LRSILTFKTAELNELVGQLELTNQAIQNVETTTADIETMLTEMGLSLDTIENNTRESMLLNAQASLDHALKSANNIYANEAEHNGAKLSRRRSLASSSSGGIQSESSEKKERMVRVYTGHWRFMSD